MKKRWKILIVLGFLWIIGSVMTADPSTNQSTTESVTNMYDLKCPDCWENNGNGDYANFVQGGALHVSKADNDTLDLYKTNDTGWSVKDWSGDGKMYAYVTPNQYGFFEVVNVNGTDYMLEHYFADDQLDSYNKGDMLGPDLLKEFNTLNNLKPIAV